VHAVLRHCIGVGLSVVVVMRGAVGLRYQRTNTHVVGFIGELSELFVDDAELFAKLTQARRCLLETSFDEPLCHCASLRSLKHTTGHGSRWSRWARRQRQTVEVHDEWGISHGYFDVDGTWHATSDSTRQRLRDAMGDPQDAPPLWFVVAGESHTLWNPCRLVLEDGTERGEIVALPSDLAIGYHLLHPVDGGPTTHLIVHPPCCPEIPVAWGVAAQIYSLWSARSWGIGDLGDVATLAHSVANAGGAAMLLSPLHQPAPSLPQQDSPYYPSSRRALNPLLISFDAAPPAKLVCDANTLIDRNQVWPIKRAALEQLYAESSTPPPLPDSIALWNAVCDEYGPDWTAWPHELRRFDPVVLAERLATNQRFAARAAFHQWCQQLALSQLVELGSTGVAIIGDLAVGFDPHGADAWQYQDVLALNARIGAPPDPFNTAGQNWGIPGFVPWRLRQVCYEPFIATVRASLRGVSGLRIDHVMGLFRQFWIPEGMSASDGAYVHFAAEELLAIICLEATRAGAFVIGEDLGTVHDGVREALAANNIARTIVLWFESEPPSQWETKALATVTTHDLPTVAGVFSEVCGDARHRARLLAITSALSMDAVIAQAHAAVLQSPARLRLLATDDLCGAIDQPNLPGTVGGTNWRRRLPVGVDQIRI